MIIIIDSDSLIYKAVLGHSELDPLDTFHTHIQNITDTVEHHFSTTHSFVMVCLCDNDNENFRYEVLPTYKVSRVPKPDNIMELYDQFQSAFRCYGPPSGYETDDYVATLANQCRLKGVNHIVCGCDKDLLQIPGNHFNYNKNRFIYIDPNETVYYIMLQMLMGDSSDNIKCIKGTGFVKAARLLTGMYTCFNMYSIVKDQYKLEYGDDWRAEFKQNWSLLKLQRRIKI